MVSFTYLDFGKQRRRAAQAALSIGVSALPAVDALIDAGADIDARSSLQLNRTALMIESDNQDHVMMSALIERGSNYTLVDQNQRTALDSAIWPCEPSNVDVFLDMDATNTFTRNQGLRWACHQCGFLGNGVEILQGILVRDGAHSYHNS